MCLAIPARIISIKDHTATVDVDGVLRRADLTLVENARIGDYVIMHAGFAIDVMDERAGRESLALLREAFPVEHDDRPA
jgi:hydrogenase expression/formation protein HypC